MTTGKNDTITDDKQETRSKPKESVKSEAFEVDLEKEYDDHSVAKKSSTSKFDNKEEFEHITRSNHSRKIGDQTDSEQTLQMPDQEPHLGLPVETEHHQDDREQHEQEGKRSHHCFTLGNTFFMLSTFNLTSR